jgi:hypothetical protein
MKITTLLSFLLVTIMAQAQDYTAVRQKIESMYESDQHYRIILDSLVMKAKLDWNDPKVQQWIPAAQKQDSTNLAEARQLLDQYGWLGIDKIGAKANETLFLIIQHADNSSILQYFPLLAQSYELGQTPAKFYAMMLDRILSDSGKPQVFGTQIQMKKENGKFIPFPIQNEKEVDQRRMKMGLEPLGKYLETINK